MRADRTGDRLGVPNRSPQSVSSKLDSALPLPGGLLLGCLFLLGNRILSFRGGVIFIVPRYSFRNVFGGKPAVILRVQNFRL
jgi:hypothetical protein